MERLQRNSGAATKAGDLQQSRRRSLWYGTEVSDTPFTIPQISSTLRHSQSLPAVREVAVQRSVSNISEQWLTECLKHEFQIVSLDRHSVYGHLVKELKEGFRLTERLLVTTSPDQIPDVLSDLYRKIQDAFRTTDTDSVPPVDPKATAIKVHLQKHILKQLKYLFELPPNSSVPTVLTCECGGEATEKKNYAAGQMSCVSLVTYPDEADDSPHKVITKPLTLSMERIDHSGIPCQNPRLGQRACAVFHCAQHLQFPQAVPKTRIILLNGLLCLEQAFVIGCHTTPNRSIKVEDSTLPTELADEIEQECIQLGQTYELDDTGIVLLEQFDQTDQSNQWKNLSNEAIVNLVVAGKINLSHLDIDPSAQQKFFEFMGTEDTQSIVQLLTAGHIKILSRLQFLASLARKGRAFRIRKMPVVNTDIDFSTPAMQASMSRAHQIDIITGQMDRNAGNIMYVQDEHENYIAVLIDSDLSMGVWFDGVTSTHLKKMSPQGPHILPSLIDQNSISAIKNFPVSAWTDELREQLFTVGEVAAAKQRYQGLQLHVDALEADSSRVVPEWTDTTYRQQLMATPCDSYVAHHAQSRVLAAEDSRNFFQLLQESLRGNGALLRDCLFSKTGIYNLRTTPNAASDSSPKQDLRLSLLREDALRSPSVIMTEALKYPSYSNVLKLYSEAADAELLEQLVTEDTAGESLILSMATGETPNEHAVSIVERLREQRPKAAQRLLQPHFSHLLPGKE